MSLYELMRFFEIRRFDDFIGLGSVALLLLMSLVQVSKIPVNPWSWIARHIGRAINGEVLKKVETVEEQVSVLRDDVERERSDRVESMDLDRAERARTRILRFNDEIINGVHHTREYFNDVLRDIDAYEDYCRAHPAYKNTMATEAISNVKRVFRRREEKNDFLVGTSPKKGETNG